MKKIIILLSAYNGEKFISEQLESLLKMRIPDKSEIKIVIRDDGSSDNTLKILESYEKKYNNIYVIKGENIGWKRSFWELLKYEKNGDYYCYCDQDDIWKKNKLVKALDILEGEEKIPSLYYSTCDIINTDGKYIYTEKNEIPDSKKKYLTCLKARGCTMIFNNSLRKLVLKSGPPLCFAHDLWTLRVASYVGKIYKDEEAQIYYRDHRGSATKADGILERIGYSVKKYRSLDNHYYYYAQELLKHYKNLLDKNTTEYLEEIVKGKSSVLYKIKLLFSKDFVMQSFVGTIELKIFMILGYYQKEKLSILEEKNSGEKIEPK